MAAVLRHAFPKAKSLSRAWRAGLVLSCLCAMTDGSSAALHARAPPAGSPGNSGVGTGYEVIQNGHSCGGAGEKGGEAPEVAETLAGDELAGAWSVDR